MSRDDEFRDWDAAYVLGALGTDERLAYERHLEGCAECRSAVAELAGLPGVLAALPAEEARSLTTGQGADPFTLTTSAPPSETAHGPGLVQSLAGSVRRRRRRIRILLASAAVAAGAVLLTSGIAAGLVSASLREQSPLAAPTATAAPGAVTLAMDQVRPGWVESELTLTPRGWGTRLDWSCSYGEAWVDVPTTYALVVTDTDGAQSVVASWTSAGPRAENLSASTSIPPDRIRSIDIRVAGSANPLVESRL